MAQSASEVAALVHRAAHDPNPKARALAALRLGQLASGAHDARTAASALPAGARRVTVDEAARLAQTRAVADEAAWHEFERSTFRFDWPRSA